MMSAIEKTEQSGPAPLLTAEQVAGALNVSLRTVRRLTGSGSLPVVRIGRSVRVTRETLAAWMSRQDRG
jgi:excisionase family DNA binding protein